VLSILEKYNISSNIMNEILGADIVDILNLLTSQEKLIYTIQSNKFDCIIYLVTFTMNSRLV